MAQFKDLIVTGVTRIVGKVYAPEFVGNLAGNASTATKATQDESGNNIKASYAAAISISDHTITLKNKNGASLGTVTVPDNNTTYGVATTSANGLMSSSDKKKLDGIASGANAYSHPTTSGNKHIPSGGSSGQILRWSADGTAAWGADNNTDTKVTAVGNHYTPSGGSTTSASGGTLTDITNSSSGVQVVTGVTKDAAGHVTGVTSVALKSTNTNTDTKNTTGSTDTSSKIFLVGATSQAANPQTYSHDTAYVGTDGCLYSNSTKVSVEGHTHNYAAASHGNHVPATQTASNKVFLRNDNTWATVTPANIGAAAASHGNHVPTTQTANNAIFLRNDNTWATVTPANIGAAAASHGKHVPDTCTTITDWNAATTTGWYMGSGITNAPSTAWYFGHVIAHNANYVIQEVYQFTASTDAKAIPKYIRAKMNGTWGAWTEVTVQKKVPSDANFTNTWRGIQNNLTSDSTTDSLAAAQGKALKSLIDGKAATSHGNHVPTTQTANNAVFLRNDNTWATVTPANIGAAASSHTHDYAASSHTHTRQSASATSDANASYLRQIATGTAAATTSNCPAGTLYGKY